MLGPQQPTGLGGLRLSILDGLSFIQNDVVEGPLLQFLDVLLHRRLGMAVQARLDALAESDELAPQLATAEFDRMFQQGGLPDEVGEVLLPASLLRDGKVLVAAALAAAGFCASNGEGRRLIQGGGVKVGGAAVNDANATLAAGRHLLQSGKRKAVHVIVPG